MDFYKPSLKLFVLANLTQGTEPKSLSLIFEYVDEKDNVHKICSSDVVVNTGSYQTLEGNCEGNSILKNVKSFNYRILGRGANGVVYKIKINGTTRVEMNKA